MILRTWNYEHGPKLGMYLMGPTNFYLMSPWCWKVSSFFRSELQLRGRLPPASDVCLEHLPDNRKIQTYAAWFADLGPLEMPSHGYIQYSCWPWPGKNMEKGFSVCTILHSERSSGRSWVFLNKPCWPTQPSFDSKTGPIVPEVQYSHQDKAERWCCAARISRQWLFSKVPGRAEERRDFGCWPTCRYGLQHMTHQT